MIRCPACGGDFPKLTGHECDKDRIVIDDPGCAVGPDQEIVQQWYRDSMPDRITQPQSTINQIAAIRARNNDLWMKLLEIALETAPDETKEVLRQINANDREISGLLSELAK